METVLLEELQCPCCGTNKGLRAIPATEQGGRRTSWQADDLTDDEVEGLGFDLDDREVTYLFVVGKSICGGCY